MNQAWILEFSPADELGTWYAVGKYPSGDAAKSNARHHQIGKGEVFDYRILAPDGSVWVSGHARHNKQGMRMTWVVSA